jgi:hypothetical protein
MVPRAIRDFNLNKGELSGVPWEFSGVVVQVLPRQQQI